MKNISAAYAKAFAKIAGATKDSVNPAFKSKYADLSSVIAAIKPALIENDLFFVQVTNPNPEGVEIETRLYHASGEEMLLGTIFVPASKKDAQGFGSATTYARRYGLQTAFGVPSEDDDGNAATANPPAAKQGITDDQLKIIQDLVFKTNTDIAKFCKHYKVVSLKALSPSDYDHACNILMQRLEENANV